MSGASDAPSPWDQAVLVAALIAVSPFTGGVVLRAGAGPVRDAWLALLALLLPDGMPMRRAPLGIGDEGLLGGLDLAATLHTGRRIARRGLLAQADGGIVLLTMAERLSPATAARIVRVMDCRRVDVDRDGAVLSTPARFGLVALDESDGSDEQSPAALVDRLAFHLELGAIGWREVGSCTWTRAQIAAARARLDCLQVADSAIPALVVAAAKLGIPSLRAPLLALGVARACCALRGGTIVEPDDIAVAARLVLAPRATTMPERELPEEADDPPLPDAREDGPEETESSSDASSDEYSAPSELNNFVLAAASAAIPAGLLAQISGGLGTLLSSSRRGNQQSKITGRRGRPLAARRGDLRMGRLALVDTMRAAAPLQRLRRKASSGGDDCRIVIRPEDFRIVRLRERSETTVIFVVDASGSAAVQRLAEVKGAIELLLADCYVRRDNVALVAFRGTAADIILPPTRSLARAKRTLGGLPGGGGTPVAAGLDTALVLADQVRRKGQLPLLVLMTDGRANIGRDGAPGRPHAFEDALTSARRVRAAGVAALAIDTAPTQQKLAEPPTFLLGQAMNARYVRLPNADSARVLEAVQAASCAT